MPVFDISDWYWRADDGRVFGSKVMALIADGDEAYARWRVDGGIPTVWPRDEGGTQTDAALDVVLSSGRPAQALPAISPRQFAVGIWGDKIIGYDEADAFVSLRVVPDKLKALLETPAFPDDDTGEPTPRKEALLLLKGATEFRFDHPLVEEIRIAQDWSPEHLRERWAVWATL